MGKQTRKTNPAGVDISRRKLMAGALTVGATAGLGLGGVNATAAPIAEKKPEKRSTCYRETEHIRRYYRCAREI